MSYRFCWSWLGSPLMPLGLSALISGEMFANPGFAITPSQVQTVQTPVVASWQDDEQATDRGQLTLVNFTEAIRQVTVRVLDVQGAGSGVIVKRVGDTYTVLTNWHVVENLGTLSVLTHDGDRYPVSATPVRVAGIDMAMIQFSSVHSYPVATLATEFPQVGDSTYAAGFPMYTPNGDATTLEQGVHNFQLNTGMVSVLLPRPLQDGYQLGYTSTVVVGMSGGPIFNQQGELLGLNARVARGLGFGAYVYGDGTLPSLEILEELEVSSLGVPIRYYSGSLPTNGQSPIRSVPMILPAPVSSQPSPLRSPSPPSSVQPSVNTSSTSSDQGSGADLGSTDPPASLLE